MKQFNTIFYLLFILLVMGTFASMAQNSYGSRIMGVVAFTFAFLFLLECISALRTKGKKDLFSLVEPACLFLISLIFGLRIFYIYFQYVEIIFSVAGALLALFYLGKMVAAFHEMREKNGLQAILMTLYYFSIILFLFSLITVPFLPAISQGLGTVAFLVLLIFIIAGLGKKNVLVSGEKIPVLKILTRLKDHSIIIISMFLLFSLYVGLNRVGILPGIYSDEYPRAYLEMVDKAASKDANPVDGKYKYEEFMYQYELFLKHNK